MNETFGAHTQLHLPTVFSKFEQKNLSAWFCACNWICTLNNNDNNLFNFPIEMNMTQTAHVILNPAPAPIHEYFSHKIRTSYKQFIFQYTNINIPHTDTHWTYNHTILCRKLSLNANNNSNQFCFSTQFTSTELFLAWIVAFLNISKQKKFNQQQKKIENSRCNVRRVSNHF